MPPAPSYRQSREPVAAKQSPHRAAAPPRLDTPAARASLRWAQDAVPIPPPRSAQIPHPPRNPLVLRSQPWTAQQSLCRPAVPGSMATRPLLPQSRMGENERIFMG